MKILQIIQKAQLRGAEIFACQLANHLIAAGHEVKLICLLEGKANLPFSGGIINLKRPLSKRLVDVQGWRMLAKEIALFQPDVIQANSGDTLKYTVLSKLLFKWKAPIVFRNASTISLYIKSPWVKWWNSFLFSHVAQVISVSETSKQDFIGLFPFVKDRIMVVSIGIECAPLSDKSVSTTPYLLHVGGFTFEKNHGQLLSIYKQMQQTFPELELWLAGDGPLRDKIEEQVKSMGLKKVRFLGYQSNVMLLIQSAKALLLPSLIEGLPGVILEAMYCRVPVVAFDVGGIPEVVRPGQTGYLVKAGDEAAFADAIKLVLEGNNEEIIERAYQQVIQHFDNRIIAQRFLSVYQEVAGHKS